MSVGSGGGKRRSYTSVPVSDGRLTANEVGHWTTTAAVRIAGLRVKTGALRAALIEIGIQAPRVHEFIMGSPFDDPSTVHRVDSICVRDG